MIWLQNVLAFCLLISSTISVEFQFLNRCGAQLWVGIQGNAGKSPLSNGGFAIKKGQRLKLQAPSNWAGRFWGRTGCNSKSQHCLTGDCGNRFQCKGNGGAPPVTLAEITLKGAGGLDYYDISLVDGYNLPVSMAPIGGRGEKKKYSCERTACARNLNSDCPNELRLKYKGKTHGCKSACLAFNTDLYCCKNRHNTPQTCRQRDFPVNYPKFFKDRCPDAYSYAYDDHKSTYTCRASTYLVTFC